MNEPNVFLPMYCNSRSDNTDRHADSRCENIIDNF
jgi:hypothetical protein